MGFGLNLSNAGDFLPYIKLDGKDGGVSRSTYDGTSRGHEIIENLVMLLDPATTRVGWMRFEGERPDKRLVALGDPLPDKPGEDYKSGVSVVVALPGGLGCHEISTTATGVLGALEAIHDKATSAPEYAQGQVPVVHLASWRKEKTQKGSRSIPQFEIAGWKPRPEELAKWRADPKPRATLGSTTARPPETGSRPMAAPAAAPKATFTEADFG